MRLPQLGAPWANHPKRRKECLPKKSPLGLQPCLSDIPYHLHVSRAPYAAFSHKPDAQQISLDRATSFSELEIVTSFPVKGYDKSHTLKPRSSAPSRRSTWLCSRDANLRRDDGEPSA